MRSGVSLGIFGLLAIILFAVPVNPLALGYEYLEDNTLLLAPGANYYFKLYIQNEQDQDAEINVTLRSEIAAIVGGGVVEVPADSYDKFVYFNISMPSDAPHGELYTISYTVTPTQSKDGGQVPIAVRYDRNLQVMSYDPGMESAKPADLDQVLKEKSFDWVTLVLVLIIIVLLVLLVLKWKKK